MIMNTQDPEEEIDIRDFKIEREKVIEIPLAKIVPDFFETEGEASSFTQDPDYL
jgi:hypothetical protein